MKRSQINHLLRDAIEFCEKMNFKLPPYAFWSPIDWQDKGSEYDEIRANMLGWDITDYGHDNFRNLGLVLFTLRNGNMINSQFNKPYAEKILIVEENQIAPMHFHWSKMEDIINRGGGNLMIELYNADLTDGLANTSVTAIVDGRRFIVPAGTVIRLKPGESVTLPQKQYHKFWAEAGYGKVLIGEVSMVNDDNIDNCFLEPMGRFPEIEEDEPVLYPLCNEKR